MAPIRFCTLTMPTTRPLSVMGISESPLAGLDAADGGSQRVLGARHLEGLGHGGLHVAVALVAQGLHNALAADDAYQLRAAHHGKILLQRVNAAHQRVGQRVRGRESGKIGEHHLAHMHRVHHRLKEDALVLDLRADHDEEAGEAQPVVMQQHSADHGGQRQHLAQSGGEARGESHAVLPREAAAQQASAVQWICGQKVQ